MRPFKLQAVLDFRKRKENEAQKSLFFCLEEKRVLAEKKENLRDELEKLFTELEKTKREGAAAADLMLLDDCIVFKKKILRDVRQKLADAACAIEQARQRLVKASQEKRALEILKENKELEERSNQMHRENIFLDEVAVFGFGERK